MKRRIITAIFIAFFIIIIITGCTKTSNNRIIKSVESPDSKYVAYIFIRDMGATTKASFQLSILQKILI